MKKIIPLILLVLFITSCGKGYDGSNGSSDSNNQYGYSYQYLEEYEGINIYEPTNYKNIIYNTHIYKSNIEAELWTINYEKINDYGLNASYNELANMAYNYVSINKDYFNSKLGFEIEIIEPFKKETIETPVLNVRNELMDIYVLDVYLPLVFDGEYVLIPIKTYTLRKYEDVIEDINGEFISYNDFYEKYI